MAIADLPSEIHHRILSNLICNRDVAALSVQCRALYLVCDMPTRKRFHRISISTTKRSIEPAFRLLLEILKKPTLRQYVRYIECYPKPLEANSLFVLKDPQRRLSGEEVALLRAAVRRAGFTGHKEKLLMNMLMQKETQPLSWSADGSS